MSSTLTAHERTVSPAAGKYLTFRLNDESYGIGVLHIREIIRLQPITPVPEMRQHVKGVINLRGKIIPVIDLRLRFGLIPKPDNGQNCIVVVQTGAGGRNLLIGLIVDGVEEVVQVSASDVEPPPEFGCEVDTSCLVGMAKLKGTVKTLLDIEKVVGGMDV